MRGTKGGRRKGGWHLMKVSRHETDETGNVWADAQSSRGDIFFSCDVLYGMTALANEQNNNEDDC